SAAPRSKRPMARNSLRIDTAARLVAAPRAAIWQALVEAERLIEWLPPQGMSGRVELWEPKPDGRFRLALRYDDPASNAGKTTAAEDLVEGRFVELLANERMIWAVTFRSDDPAFAGE